MICSDADVSPLDQFVLGKACFDFCSDRCIVYILPGRVICGVFGHGLQGTEQCGQLKRSSYEFIHHDFSNGFAVASMATAEYTLKVNDHTKCI